MYVIDASVYVADARPAEPHHAEATALLARLRADGSVTHAPLIVLAEVASAISRGTGRPALARRWIAALRLIPRLRLHPVDETLAQAATDLAGDYQLRACDAVYVALAERLAAVLVTLDGQQRERVPAHVLARTPAEELATLNGETDPINRLNKENP